MATTIALVNMKSGVGKSTLTVNLAWEFSARKRWGKKVLVVDLDPQFNASQYLLGVREYEKTLDGGKPTVWDIFEPGTRPPAGRVELPSPTAPIHRCELSERRDRPHSEQEQAPLVTMVFRAADPA